MLRLLPSGLPSIHTGSQFAAVLVVLIAIFALPCCPRVDGMFHEAAAVAAASAESATSHAHHAGHEAGFSEQTEGGSSDSVHKGHLMSTGSVDTLPVLAPFALAARLPLSRMGITRILSFVATRGPRIPVPPPQVAI
jgi:hypothetical protein